MGRGDEMTIRQLEPGKARGAFKEKMWTSDQFVAQKKYDGTRALMHSGLDGNRFTSRHISKKDGNYVEKTNNFPHLRDIFTQSGLESKYNGCIFDGELITGKNVMDVTRITGSLPERAIQIQNECGWLSYVVFDVLFDNGVDIRGKPYSYRRDVLEGYLADLGLEHLIVAEDVESGKREFFEEILDSGGEGVILKDINAPYGKNWSKCKKTAMWDVIITGFKDAKEITKKVSGEESISKFAEKKWIGAIEFGQYLLDGTLMEFGFCSGMDDALREKISNNREYYIGKVMEIGAQERLVSGKFRHPRFLRFRSDKNPEECVYRLGES
jgi:bifunctional non-homologous end joining protein LigD